jgi:F0F1-type ATP synthase assembly protein I
MANHSQTEPTPGVTGLVTGIIHDAQQLIQQQMALLQHEIRSDFEKTKEAATSLVFSLPVLLIGGILLGQMLVYLLQGFFPELPLWGCYGIVGGVTTAVGTGLFYLGIKRFGSFNPLPDESAQAMKENVQWLMKRN